LISMLPPLLNFSSIYIIRDVLIQQKGKKRQITLFLGV
jgi:hypothetical protein